MYLTQMPLNPARRSTREMLASPQRTHAAVLSAFVPGTAESGRILWRLDQPEKHRLDLYIVSPIAPSLEAMSDQAGWPSQPVWRTADYRPFLNRLERGQHWIFRLRANPIKNVRPGPQRRGRRVPLIQTKDQIEWLSDKGEKSGFRITSGEHGSNIRVSGQGKNNFDRCSDGERRTVTLQTVTFDGVLEVTDPVSIRAALISGIGAAKGYGCGLMTLAPVP